VPRFQHGGFGAGPMIPDLCQTTEAAAEGLRVLTSNDGFAGVVGGVDGSSPHQTNMGWRGEHDADSSFEPGPAPTGPARLRPVPLA
jgi:hypothetical protein